MQNDIKHVHLIAVCGTGMAALAGMLREKGFYVTGSDKAFYPPMSNLLESQKIDVFEGFAPENLNAGPDLVVIGNAVSRSNIEAQETLKRNIPYLSMPETLGRFFLAGHDSIVIAGTHGKTTTSSLMASMLFFLGMDPGFFIGGIARNFDSNFRLGQGTPFVVEGDEYDSAFFDKGPKFLHYQPKIAIITGIEFDHADIYSSLDQIVENFRKLVALIPEDGLLVAAGEDPRVASILDAARCPVITYGCNKDANWNLRNVNTVEGRVSGDIFREGNRLGELSSPLPGAYNLLNALAVSAVLFHLDFSLDEINAALKNFAGVKKRQEVRGEVHGITVIDDFAHHPTAVSVTCRAIADFYPGRRLIAVFEPRTNTSRRAIFQNDYPKSFAAADMILVKEIFAPENIPEQERFSSRRLALDLTQMGKDAHYFPTTEEIIDFLLVNCRDGDVVLIMSNGAFDNIHDRLLKGLGDIKEI